MYVWFLRTSVRQGSPSSCREDGLRNLKSILMWLISQTFNRTMDFFSRALPFRCI